MIIVNWRKDRASGKITADRICKISQGDKRKQLSAIFKKYLIMRYTSDIYELPLSVFIEIYTNDSNTIEFDDEDKGLHRQKLSMTI